MVLKFLDALCTQDKHIHCIGKLKKVWSQEGSIYLQIGSNVHEAVHNEQVKEDKHLIINTIDE